jgi:Na+/H+ antiporter NhaD/arsenite permease-like protein
LLRPTRHALSVVLLALVGLLAAGAAHPAVADAGADAPVAAAERQEAAAPGGSHAAEGSLGARLPLWSVIPFAGILLSIALFPLLAPSFWHHHYPKVAAAWGLIFALPFLGAYGGPAWSEILHIYVIDYIPFIILLWGLFTVSGGILVSGTLHGTPAVNSLLMLVGTLVASWVGTTGASMLLIRPLLRANAWRQRKAHVVIFFIFLVSNIGGSLTPLGDPPLFLGFLHGVPFFWTLHLLPHMGVATALLLVVFYCWDSIACRREAAAAGGHAARAAVAGAPAGSARAGAASGPPAPFRVEGLFNFLLLGGIVVAVLLSGVWHPGHVELGPVHLELQNLTRDLLIVAMGLLSLWLTPADLRKRNEFGWGPIKEVAILFAGIFMTIIPALAILKAGAAGSLAFLLAQTRDPLHYFWFTGALSSFLDNAPTYLTFFSSALGRFYEGIPEREAVHLLISQREAYLAAISAGAVFMGANTYIGNAPNFMVKAIAEEAGVKMPSFFGYLFAYSVPILIPIFIVITWLFF